MGKEQAQRATFQDLINKHMEKEKKAQKLIKIYVPSMDREMIFKTPDDDLVLEIMDDITDTDDLKGAVKAYSKLIYLTCDLLQNPELHKELDIVDPFDTVKVIFDIDEIMTIGDQLVSHINLIPRDEEIKN